MSNDYNVKFSFNGFFTFLIKVGGVLVLIILLGGLATWGFVAYSNHKDEVVRLAANKKEQDQLSRMVKFQSESRNTFRLEGDKDGKLALVAHFLRNNKDVIIEKDGKYAVYDGFSYNMLSGTATKSKGDDSLDYEITYHYSKGGALYMIENNGYRYLFRLSSPDKFTASLDENKIPQDKRKPIFAQYNELARLTGSTELK